MSKYKKKILIADDDDKIRFAFNKLFKTRGFGSIEASNGEEAIEKIVNEKPDLVFLDVTMPVMTGLDVLKDLKEKNIYVPVVIITGLGTMKKAIDAIKLGAFDYHTKPLDLEKINKTINRAFSSQKIKSDKAINSSDFSSESYGDYEIIGKSLKSEKIFKLIGSAATTPNHTTVLITGETGTGKELVARNIHMNSDNSSEPFITVNCSSLPDNLLESELFGHEKGAFTGAHQSKAGKFEIVGSGTIFLDEIGILSVKLQHKLLRALQSRQFERVGGNETFNIEARFIAATNEELEKEVEKGNFREDLFYRLNVASIYVPPLRDRKDDIPILTGYFLGKYNYILNKNIEGFSEEAMQLITDYNFPGNVRELENIVERAVMLTRSHLIVPADLPDKLLSKKSDYKYKIPITDNNFRKSKENLVTEFEKKFIKDKLGEFKGNVSKAANNSGMTRQNFQRLMQKYNIDAENFRT